MADVTAMDSDHAARLGVISIKITAMTDSTLMSTAIASGKIPPIA